MIGFRVPRKGASQAIARHLATRWFAPEALRTGAQEQSLHSAFLPLYAWTARARSRFDSTVGIDWTRTETYTTTVNGKTVTRTRTVRETEWFPLSGEHGIAWDDHLVSASRGLAEWEATALEPFDLGAARPWDPSLVAGHVAEHATIPHPEAQVTAEAQVRALAADDVRGDFQPGDRSRGVQVHTDVSLDGPRLVLAPVWIAVLQGGEHTVRLLVNGQTGEVAGKVPHDPFKIAGAVLGGLTLVAGVVGLIYLLGSA